ncbi:MAG: hypothetical protein ABI347_03630 [Nitrososphaera sp.]|jgi:hypothetical protein
MRVAVIATIAGGIVAVALIALFASTTIPTKDYSLSVDAMKDEQSLFTNARVVLTNTGRLALTNVVIDYGNGTETIGTMAPGAKVIRSPHEGAPLDSVTVTADNGINIVQDYRRPIKLPGMIGS